MLLTPGKGWVLYKLPKDHPAEAQALGTTGYARFLWSVIEPAEGKYNFKPIDDAVSGPSNIVHTLASPIAGFLGEPHRAFSWRAPPR